MAEQKYLEQAKATYATLCQAFDNHKWHYEKDEEELTITCEAQSDDLPMEVTVRVDPERRVVLLLSLVPFVVEEDKRIDVAIAVSEINKRLVDGCFDYDVLSGHMFFRMTNSFIESKIGEDVFSYMLLSSCHVIDKYNDKFMLLGRGLITVEQFLEKV